jgi:hypothetical protein
MYFLFFSCIFLISFVLFTCFCVNVNLHFVVYLFLFFFQSNI